MRYFVNMKLKIVNVSMMVVYSGSLLMLLAACRSYKDSIKSAQPVTQGQQEEVVGAPSDREEEVVSSTPSGDTGNSPSANSRPARKSTVTVNDLATFQADAFDTKDELYQRVQTMVDFGPRHTGSRAHNNYMDHVEEWMKSVPLEGISRDTVNITGANWMSRGGALPKTTQHIYGHLPGRDGSDKAIILGVHFDGQNSIQENGVPVLMAITDYLSRMPREKRPYTYYVVFPSGHMAEIQGGIEALSWANLHRDIIKRTVAVVSPEHMGVIDEGQVADYNVTVSSSNVKAMQGLRSYVEGLRGEMDIQKMSVRALGIGSGLAWSVPILGSGKPVFSGLSTHKPLTTLFNPDVGMEIIDKDLLYKHALFFLKGTLHMSSR